MIEASCHCGAVRFTVASAPTTLTDCNCSICRRYSALWAYYPAAEVAWPNPPGGTDIYVWGDRKLEFHRCRGCGCLTHWAPTDPARIGKRGINARLLPPEAVAAARIRRFDGAETWTYLD